MRKKSQPVAGSSTLNRWRKWLAPGIILMAVVLLVGAWQMRSQAAATREAPEAPTILEVQSQMPFQILIPAYMPREIEREKVTVDVTETGPGGEPMVSLAYHSTKDDTLFIKQWVPINPDKEVLAGSRPVQTVWGQGWMIDQGDGLVALWVDVGPTRLSIFSPAQKNLNREQILKMAETLGPASSSQVFDFVLDLPEVRAVEPPPPFEPPVNQEGVQEFTLVVTPGGYDPLRIQLKAGVPVKMNFRAIGQVGCGKELIFPIADNQVLEGKLKTEADNDLLEFTPQQPGSFEFHCSHQMYRGLLTVVP